MISDNAEPASSSFNLPGFIDVGFVDGLEPPLPWLGFVGVFPPLELPSGLAGVVVAGVVVAGVVVAGVVVAGLVVAGAGGLGGAGAGGLEGAGVAKSAKLSSALRR